MTASIARYLKDFGEPPPAPAMPFENEREYDIGTFAIEEAPVDLEAERKEAHREGYEAGLEDARSAWEEERQKLVDEHAAALNVLRQRHENDLIASVQEKMSGMALLLAEAISNQTSVALAPLLEKALVSKAVADLAVLVRAAIVEGDIAVVTVHGPASLHEQLTEALDDGTRSSIRHVEAPDLDITVDLGEAALVTRMSAWSARLKEVLA